LCERYAVDHSKRTIHGALLDAQLLADVWLAMTRGQETLDMGMTMTAESTFSMHLSEVPSMAAVRVLRASDAERAAHAAMCERIARESKAGCLWMQTALAS
jgi:DNA polymerase-3 subunit epsilon